MARPRVTVRLPPFINGQFRHLSACFSRAFLPFRPKSTLRSGGHAAQGRNPTSTSGRPVGLISGENSPEEGRRPTPHIKLTQGKPKSSWRKISHGGHHRRCVSGPSGTTNRLAYHTRCRHRHPRRVQPCASGSGSFQVHGLRRGDTLVRSHSAPIRAEVVARSLGTLYRSCSHSHAQRWHPLCQSRGRHYRSWRIRTVDRRQRQTSCVYPSRRRNLPASSKVAAAASRVCRILGVSSRFLQSGISIHPRSHGQVARHQARRGQVGQNQLRNPKESSPCVGEGSCVSPSLSGCVLTDDSCLPGVSGDAEDFAWTLPDGSDPVTMGHALSLSSDLDDQPITIGSLAPRPTLPLLATPSPTVCIPPGDRCQRPPVGGSHPEQPVGRLLHPDRESSPYHSQGDSCSAARPTVVARPTSRDTASPVSGQSAVISCPPTLAHEEFIDARSDRRNSPTHAPEVLDSAPPLDPQRREPSGRPEQGSPRLGRLQVQPEVVDPLVVTLEPSVANSGPNGVPVQQDVPTLCEQGPAAGRLVPGCVLEATVSDPGSSPLLQPALASDSQAVATLQLDADRPVDGSGDSGVAPSDVVSTPLPAPAVLPEPPSSLRDVLGSLRPTDASAQVVKQYISDLWADYEQSEQDTTVLSSWCMLASVQNISGLAHAYKRLLVATSIDTILTSSPQSFLHYLRQLTDSSDKHVSAARDYFCAVVRFPSFAPLLRHDDFSRWRTRHLFTTPVRHTAFYDLHPLLQSEPTLDWSSKDQVRFRLVLCLSVYHLGRAIDIARLKRTFTSQPSALLLSWRRKDSVHDTSFVAHEMSNTEWSIPHLIRKYILLTASQNSATYMLVSHNAKRPGNICNKTVSGWRTKWLRLKLQDAGLDGQQYSSHSFRGASTLLLLRHKVSPRVVREMGGWSSESSFNRYYCKLEAALNPPSALPITSLPLQDLQPDSDMLPFIQESIRFAAGSAPVQSGNRLRPPSVSQCQARDEPNGANGAGCEAANTSGSLLSLRGKAYRGESHEQPVSERSSVRHVHPTRPPGVTAEDLLAAMRDAAPGQRVDRLQNLMVEPVRAVQGAASAAVVQQPDSVPQRATVVPKPPPVPVRQGTKRAPSRSEDDQQRLRTDKQFVGHTPSLSVRSRGDTKPPAGKVRRGDRSE